MLTDAGLGRRTLLGAASLVAVASRARGQPAPRVIALWPSAPPRTGGPRGPEKISAKGAISGISRSRVNVYRPARANGAAAVVIAGGGYARIEAASESAPACRWLQSIGVTAFELIYRLPADGWPATAPFQDGQRAMRIVRAAAPRQGIDPARIGVIGFSAGGHLAGMTCVRPDATLYPPADASDTVSARPDFAGLIYPVLTMMPPYDQTRSRREILGDKPTRAESEAYSVERLVTAETPPVFLAQAANDPISPIENSLMMFAALKAAQRPLEMHVFQTGGHGWGMGRPGTEEQAWPGLFVAWAAGNGFLPALAENG